MAGILGVASPFAAASGAGVGAGDVAIEVETAQGSVSIALNRAAAPKAVDWLLGIVDRGGLDGTAFFRVGQLAGHSGRPQFVEGGVLAPFLLGETDRKPTTAVEAGVPTLRDWETTETSGLRHLRGAVSLGRDISGDGAVLPELVILLESVPGLDHGGGRSPGNLGHPVVGVVTSGMSIIESLTEGPRDRVTYIPLLAGQILREPLRITRVRRAGSSVAKP